MKSFVLSLFLILSLLYFQTVNAQNGPEIPRVIKEVGCGPRCTYVKCAPAKIEDCSVNQVLIPRDGDCYCCDGCIDMEPFQHECNPDNCNLVDCNPKITVDYCREKNWAFAKRDGKCVCCDMCIQPQSKPKSKV